MSCSNGKVNYIHSHTRSLFKELRNTRINRMIPNNDNNRDAKDGWHKKISHKNRNKRSQEILSDCKRALIPFPTNFPLVLLVEWKQWAEYGRHISLSPIFATISLSALLLLLSEWMLLQLSVILFFCFGTFAIRTYSPSNVFKFHFRSFREQKPIRMVWKRKRNRHAHIKLSFLFFSAEVKWSQQ